MSTISIADLKKKSAEDLLNSAGKENVVITSGGQPVALLLDIQGVSAGSTEALVRSIAALKAQSFLQKNSAAGLTMPDIDVEIADVRRERKK
jgi:antitoxin (DNA-binding transcriptional repressor) of toxin-antitoxin stability system